jgi:hypothetical protein
MNVLYLVAGLVYTSAMAMDLTHTLWFWILLGDFGNDMDGVMGLFIISVFCFFWER